MKGSSDRSSWSGIDDWHLVQLTVPRFRLRERLELFRSFIIGQGEELRFAVFKQGSDPREYIVFGFRDFRHANAFALEFCGEIVAAPPCDAVTLQ